MVVTMVPELSCPVWLAGRISCLCAPVSKGNCMTQQGSNTIQLWFPNHIQRILSICVSICDCSLGHRRATFWLVFVFVFVSMVVFVSVAVFVFVFVSVVVFVFLFVIAFLHQLTAQYGASAPCPAHTSHKQSSRAGLQLWILMQRWTQTNINTQTNKQTNTNKAFEPGWNAELWIWCNNAILTLKTMAHQALTIWRNLSEILIYGCACLTFNPSHSFFCCWVFVNNVSLFGRSCFHQTLEILVMFIFPNWGWMGGWEASQNYVTNGAAN